MSLPTGDGLKPTLAELGALRATAQRLGVDARLAWSRK